ncbi:MAG: hypothetical protein ACD_11C00108G0012 [uncultured bacterium]|nr:MAG: hypothetical protein ACD_11C00108G0012 [uncultured bacterium]HBR71418.1 hypothetical protein [Candidatus Moranbacteria bacterium]
MKKTLEKNKKGFTLVEMLLYVAITGVIIFSISIFLSIVLEARVRNRTMAEVEQEGMRVMQIISQVIRNSNVINSPTIGTSAASISLGVVDGAKNPTLFDFSSGVVRMKEGASAYVSLTTSRLVVSNLTFTNLSRVSTPGTIRIQFTLTHTKTDSRDEYDYTRTFYGSASLR